MNEIRWTISAIRRAMSEAGSHWWDKESMRFFNTRVASTCYNGPGGSYFVTSDRFDGDPVRYTVRQFDRDKADIRPQLGFRAFRDLDNAKSAARDLAKGIVADA